MRYKQNIKYLHIENILKLYLRLHLHNNNCTKNYENVFSFSLSKTSLFTQIRKNNKKMLHYTFQASKKHENSSGSN